jgi:phosphoserine phosphatase
VFDFQRTIIDRLKALQFKIYIVTASITWAVEPAAELFGLSKDCVLGVQTKIKNGLVTDERDGVITYREGKSEALLAKTGGRPPLFVAGNTEGDLFLLESAARLRLVIASADPKDSHYATEQSMQKLARERGWYRHSFLD